MGYVVPGDHADVEEPLGLDSMLPAGTGVAVLTDKIRGVPGDEVLVSELGSGAILDLI
jgi:hypothetical protein